MASAALAWLSAQVKLFCAKQLRPAATKARFFAQWFAPIAEIGFSGNHFAREGNGIRCCLLMELTCSLSTSAQPKSFFAKQASAWLYEAPQFQRFLSAHRPLLSSAWAWYWLALGREFRALLLRAGVVFLV